jgi:tRNA(adenine34) deaminase
MSLTRRALLPLLAALGALRGIIDAVAETLDERRRFFVEAAFAMRRLAERSGDQPYGAVVVRGDDVVGWGPSRVVVDKNWDAHAERVALKDAQARLGRANLSDCVMYSTSRPCGICEQAAAAAGLARMYYGPDAIDAGVPRMG